MVLMGGVSAPCDECEGKGFQAEVLEYTLGGLNIREVLDLPVTAALEHFGSGESRIPAVIKILDILAEVGLGYVSLGQPLTTLSGGERQRLKLAVHLSAKAADAAQIIILDEPTTGLHLADVENLQRLLDRARRFRSHRHRHRTPPGGDGSCRSHHRPGTWRRTRRRNHRVRRQSGRFASQ
jgi:excinuclease UvrABC ATPase subunit